MFFSASSEMIVRFFPFDQGSNPHPLRCKADSLPLDHQGSPCVINLILNLLFYGTDLTDTCIYVIYIFNMSVCVLICISFELYFSKTNFSVILCSSLIKFSPLIISGLCSTYGVYPNVLFLSKLVLVMIYIF